MATRNLYRVTSRIKTICEASVCTQINIRKTSLWTQDGVIKSPYKSIEIPDCTLDEYVFQNIGKWSNRTASVCSETGRSYVYEELYKKSSTFAANLRKKLKIADGETVAIMLPNIPEYPIVALGILQAGGVITTINPVYTAHEIQRQLVMSEARVIVTLPETSPVVKKALEIAKVNIPIIAVKANNYETPAGTIIFSELTDDLSVDKSCLKEVKRTTKNICFMPYSSGTTGLPKGVELINSNIISNCEQLNEPLIKCHKETTASHQDVVMTVLPLFHIYAATVIMFHKLSHGIKLVTLSKFQPESYLRALEEYRCNVVFLAPPLVLMMTNHPAATPKTYKHLDIVMSGAAPFSATDVERFLEKAQREIDYRHAYGLTETSPVVSVTEKNSNKYDSVGYAVPSTELRIVDNNLKNLAPNEKGELLVRGPQVMKGYRNNVQANSESLTTDGWLRTGDLAVIDEVGVITIADRLKELIKVKGFQVPPAELEAVLRDHPSVSDAAVIGVPHPTSGETPKAFIVLRKNCYVAAKDIGAFVNERVAPYKKVDDIVFLDSIPKSASEKILRRELKEKYILIS